MLQYVCDTCGMIKGDTDPWILGFAVERLGVHSAAREISLAPAWDENRAVQWFAVHFCSARCKDEYIDRLFNEPASEEVIETLPAGGRSAVVAKTIRPRTKSRASGKSRGKKRRVA
jgi:hypothetical protein